MTMRSTLTAAIVATLALGAVAHADEPDNRENWEPNSLLLMKIEHASDADVCLAIFGAEWEKYWRAEADKRGLHNCWRDYKSITLATRYAWAPEPLKSELIRELQRRGALTQAQRKRIEEGKLNIGDSELMIYAVLGEPEDINRTVGSFGEHKQWVYPSQLIYTENGKVTGWQD